MKSGRFVLLSFVVLAFVACDSGGGDDATPGQDTVTQTDTGSPAQDTVGGEEDSGSTADLGCIPNCSGRSCGDDECGGVCGTCADGEVCTPAGTCFCQAQCDDRECGDDGCGGSCGSCGLGFVCDGDEGACVAGGGISCSAYFVCVDLCEGDEECEGVCATARVEDVGTLTEDLSACLEASCSEYEFDPSCSDYGEDDETTSLQKCGYENCGADFASCFVGDGACVSVLGCVRDCLDQYIYGEANYDACRFDCLALGSWAEQAKYVALESCVAPFCDHNQPPADYRECEDTQMWANCPGEATLCSDL